jgi:hypothetical protein
MIICPYDKGTIPRVLEKGAGAGGRGHPGGASCSDLPTVPISFVLHSTRRLPCSLHNREMEKEQQFDTLPEFKNALGNWFVAAKLRY